MRRTQYTEHMEKIKCSDEFREKMERQLSSAPSEVHEYEDSVQGVERARGFSFSRFGALAAALVVIAGGGVLGYNGVKNIRPDETASSISQFASDFPYQEIFDLYNSQQIHGTAVYKNIGLGDISGFEPGEMTNERFERLINNFEMNSWNTVEARDMSDTKGMQDVSFILHPDGYERFTGVYYIFQILENNDAYFIKYDMADDSLPDHIVSEYCYQFTEGTFERYREILRAEDAAVSEDDHVDEIPISADEPQSPPFGSFDGKSVVDIAYIQNLEHGVKAEVKEVTDEAKNEIIDILRNYPWETTAHEEGNDENLAPAMTGLKAISIILDEDAQTAVCISPEGKMIAADENGTPFVYDTGTHLYDVINEIAATLQDADPFNGEIASQEEIDSFVDEGIGSQMHYHMEPPLMKEVQLSVSGIGAMAELDEDTVEAIKEKLRSFTWEKGNVYAPYIDEYDDYEREFMWTDENGHYVSITEDGLMYSGYKSYRLTNNDNIAEIMDILNANITNTSTDPDYRLMESISNGYNFRNMTGTYKAQFTVPAEVSESGNSFVIDSEGTAYIDKENSGIMLEGSGTVSYNNKAETERYAYLKYPDGRERYDEAKGEGESTAHYNGHDDLFPMLDYTSLYKQVLLDVDSYYNGDSNNFITDKDNSDGTHLYAFYWKNGKEKKRVNVTVNEQGKITSYIKTNGDGSVENSFELIGDYVFDSDGFAMPEMYEINDSED